MIKLVLHRPRPVPSLYDGLWSYAFPSGHAVMSTVVYGFLAVLIARDWAPARRWIVYSSVVATVCLIAVSRLYLGAHWFSDVIGGLSLGTAWVSLLGIAYYRRNRQAPLPPSVPIIAVVALALAAGWHIDRRYSDDLARYTSRAEPQRMDASRWWQQDWRRLPAYREDLEGGMEQPLNLQWAGSLTALSAMLGAAGWTEPVPLAPRTALRWLLPAPSLETLPLLPQVHDGRHESLVLIRPARREAASGQGASGRPGQSDQLVLRLWATDIVLGTDSIPLWVGYVSLEGLRSFAMLNVPVGEGAYGAAVSQTESALRGVSSRTVSRDLGPGGSVGAWDGRVLLLRSD
jgi:undecaprenyl-diphosphatase